MSDNNANIEYEVTPTSQKGKVSLPKEGTNELMLATACLVNTVTSGFKSVGTMLKNSTNVIGKPIEALINGKTNEIELANQFITARLMYVKETNATMHMAYVAEELNKKVENGEKIPEEIKKSDSLNLIQENASTTSEEEFLRLWAKMYAEESCKPGSISRKTIKTLESLDSNIVKLLEKDIFPYCDEEGFFWGDDTKLQSLVQAQDYGIVDIKQIVRIGLDFKTMLNVKLNDTKFLYIHPAFSYAPYGRYLLTTSGIEMKKILKIYPNEEQLKEIYKTIEKSAESWHIAQIHENKVHLKTLIKNVQKFVICDSSKNIIFPENRIYKTADEFYNNAITNLEINNM